MLLNKHKSQSSFYTGQSRAWPGRLVLYYKDEMDSVSLYVAGGRTTDDGLVDDFYIVKNWKLKNFHRQTEWRHMTRRGKYSPTKRNLSTWNSRKVNKKNDVINRRLKIQIIVKCRKGYTIIMTSLIMDNEAL